ncbi:hypothetical protein Poly41_14430 [Novipirellula artificiosorum]|uniref:Uncharacterized protein n=1 Tax=Novipirellula artificiosorum TaxID=2528016 RepID=A0A5C6DV93_9BACT|nr:hypothetical protein Poly41_14430 [Novipirellula artificiosorum]
MTFPLLKDNRNRVADAVGAQRTPEVFLLDHDRVIRYRGRIDDQYGVGYSREREVQQDLATAIEKLLAGDPIAIPETEAVGCHIGRVKPTIPTGPVFPLQSGLPTFLSCLLKPRRSERFFPLYHDLRER